MSFDIFTKTPVRPHAGHDELVHVSRCKLCHEETETYQYILTSSEGGSQTVTSKDNICDSCLEAIRKHFGIEDKEIKK